MNRTIRIVSALVILLALAIAIVASQVTTSTTAHGATASSTNSPQVNCTLYASPSGSGTSCTSGSPCSLDSANDRASAGSTVCLMAGVYQRSSTFYPRGGNSGAYVTYSGGVNGEAILRWNGGQGNVINTNGANYVTIQDMTVDGAGRNYYTGVGLDNSHHITARGLYVMNAGEAGIYALNSDYVTIDHNLVFHNGYNGYGWSSGIGMNRPSHFDRAPGFHYYFTNNIISGEFDGSSYHTDGNGVIIDGGYSSSIVTDPTLIANNVVYSNGGRCIIIYEQTGNHWVVNNTCYKNALDLQVGGCGGMSRGCSEEFFVQGSQNNRFVNNIGRSWDTQHPFGGCCGSSGNPLNHNLWFGNGGNNLSSYSVTSLLNGNPLFVNPPSVSDSIPGSPGEGWFNNAMDPRQVGNRLQLQSGSPAINAGIDPASLTSDGAIRAGLQQYVYRDINGATRPQAGAFDLGAYEYGGVTGPTPTLTPGLPPGTPTSPPTSAATRTNTPVSTNAPSNTPNVTSTPIQGAARLDAGTDQSHVDSNGNQWVGEFGFTGGQTIDRGPISIANTNDPWIYRTERYGMSGYALSVPNGTYTVRLHFAETYDGITGPGQRLFDVALEDNIVLPSFDVYATAGGANRALIRTFNVTVSDGELNVDFTQNLEMPEINGIEIIPGGSSTPTKTPGSGGTPTTTPTIAAGCQGVTWANTANVTATGNTIQKTGGVPATWDAGAISTRAIQSGNGYVQATVDALNTYRMFGLSNGNSGAVHTDIDFAAYLAGPELIVYEQGANRGTFGTLAVGDVIRVAIEGGVVKYYRNGTLVYTSTRTVTYPLLVDTAINSSLGRIASVQICGDNLGPNSTHTPTVTPTFAAGCQEVVWTSLANVTATGNNIQKTGGAPGTWDAGAISTRAIQSGDGYVQATVDALNTYRMFGLSNGNSGPAHTDIDFAAYLAGSELIVYEQGANRGTFGTLAVGDVIRVAIEGGVVKYYRNGTLVYTSTRTVTYPLLVDSAINSSLGRITNVQICGDNLGPNSTHTPTTTPTPAAGCQEVAWTNTANVTATGNTIQKTGGAPAWDAGAVSTRAIQSGDGYVQATVDALNTYRMFGLSNGNSGPAHTDIDFAAYLAGSELIVYERGVNKGTFGALAVGDVIRVSVQGGVVKYYRNGTLVYTSTATPTYPLLMDTAIHSLLGRVANAYICGANVRAGNAATVTPTVTQVAPVGGTPVAGTPVASPPVASPPVASPPAASPPAASPPAATPTLTPTVTSEN